MLLRAALPLLLLACNPDAREAALPFAEAPPPPGPILDTLVLTSAPAITQGLPTRVIVEGAAPNQIVKLYGSRQGPGTSNNCPAALNNNCINLRSPSYLGVARADAQGTATMEGIVPPDALLGPFWLQAVATRVTQPVIQPARSRVNIVQVRESCRRTTWWPDADFDLDGRNELPYRVLVDVTAGMAPVAGAPVTLDVDFAATLASLGVAGEFDPASLRVVRQDCDLDFPVLPAQFADSLVALDQKAEHLSPTGDGHGTVAFLMDDDGDPSTREGLTPGETTTFGLYFATTDAAVAPASWASEMVVVDGPPVSVSTGPTTASFDPARGGLLSSLSYRGSGPLTDQASSCCGNALHYWAPTTAPGRPFGWVTPQSAAADLVVLEEGPVFVALRTSGTRTGIVPTTGADYGTYDFDDLYWVFAFRPEIWHSVHHTAVTDIQMEHEPDVSHGFRPVQLRHAAAVYTNGVYENDPAETWMAVTGAEWGVSMGLTQPPAWLARLENPVGTAVGGPIAYAFMAIHGNDFVEPGALPPFIVPAGTEFFDHVGTVFLPFAAPFADDLSELEGLIEGVAVGPQVPGRMP
jgi:hypothetical protein